MDENVQKENVRNEVVPEKKSKDQTAMVLGIAAIGCYMAYSFIGCCMGWMFGIASPILAVIAIVYAIKAQKQEGKWSAKALAGVICGIYALYQSVMMVISSIMGSIFMVFWFILVGLEESGLLWDVILDFAPVLLGL